MTPINTTPPTPAGAEELAAELDIVKLCVSKPGLLGKCVEALSEYRCRSCGEPLKIELEYDHADVQTGEFATIIARHFQPLREELARVSKEQDGALEMLDTVARGFDVALARLLAGDRQGAERELKLAITHIDRKDFAGGSIAALRTENAALREEVERLKASLQENARARDFLRRECDKADLMEREIEDIQQMTGCNHVEGIAKCCRDALTAAEARCKELEADKARLDWLEAKSKFIISTTGSHRGYHELPSIAIDYWIGKSGVTSGLDMTPTTLRAAIDAARGGMTS